MSHSIWLKSHLIFIWLVANGGHHDELSIENNNDIVTNDETELHEEVEVRTRSNVVFT